MEKELYLAQRQANQLLEKFSGQIVSAEEIQAWLDANLLEKSANFIYKHVDKVLLLLPENSYIKESSPLIPTYTATHLPMQIHYSFIALHEDKDNFEARTKAWYNQYYKQYLEAWEKEKEKLRKVKERKRVLKTSITTLKIHETAIAEADVVAAREDFLEKAAAYHYQVKRFIAFDKKYKLELVKELFNSPYYQIKLDLESQFRIAKIKQAKAFRKNLAEDILGISPTSHLELNHEISELTRRINHLNQEVLDSTNNVYLKSLAVKYTQVKAELDTASKEKAIALNTYKRLAKNAKTKATKTFMKLRDNTSAMTL